MQLKLIKLMFIRFKYKSDIYQGIKWIGNTIFEDLDFTDEVGF